MLIDAIKLCEQAQIWMEQIILFSFKGLYQVKLDTKVKRVQSAAGKYNSTNYNLRASVQFDNHN